VAALVLLLLLLVVVAVAALVLLLLLLVVVAVAALVLLLLLVVVVAVVARVHPLVCCRPQGHPDLAVQGLSGEAHGAQGDMWLRGEGARHIRCMCRIACVTCVLKVYVLTPYNDHWGGVHV
jgi:hypothetical protein